MKSKSRTVVETTGRVLDVVQMFIDNAGHDYLLESEDDYNDLISAIERVIEDGYAHLERR